LANLNSPLKKQPSFAHRGRVDVVGTKPLKKRGQFPDSAISTAG
jgi:hypothetical protein